MGNGRIPSKTRPKNHGYTLTRVTPDSIYYPMVSLSKRRRGWVGSCTTHRYVMAVHMGRPLESWEVVHHINHDRSDNRLENLELIQSTVVHNAETVAHKEMMKMKKRIEELEDKYE